jgi:hypothetical protein
MVVEVRHCRIVGEWGHLIWGDILRASLLQRSHRSRELGWWWQWRLATHVQARRGAGTELRHGSSLERAGLLVKLCGRIVLLLAIHDCSTSLGTRKQE